LAYGVAVVVMVATAFALWYSFRREATLVELMNMGEGLMDA
jgi:hypothetical protein